MTDGITTIQKVGFTGMALSALAGVPTLVFPLICGVSRLAYAPSNPAPPWWWTNTAQNPIRSTIAWAHYADADGWTGYAHLFWSQAGWWWKGFDVTHALAPRLAASALAGVAVAIGLVVAAIRSASPKTRTERHHERGSKLVAREDAPKFVRELVIREVALASGSLAAIKTRWSLWLWGAGPGVKAVWADRKVQPRTITKAVADADAKVLGIARIATDDYGLVRMAGIPMPYSSETLHTLMAASP